MVELILRNKSLDVDSLDEDGTNCFWLASYYGYGEIMKLLAEAGADVLNFDKDGNNALHTACKKNNICVVQ
jgi:ankyrin repeat protein